MFQRLKECKTFKEIFTILGTKPFEKVAFGVIFVWVLIPVLVIIPRIWWYFRADNEYQFLYAIRDAYYFIVSTWGYATVYVAIFFLISRVAVYGKEVWKKVKAEPWHFLLLAMLLWGCISTLQAENIKLAYEGDVYLAEGLRTYFAYAGVYICSFMIVKQKSKGILLNTFNIVANIISLIVIVVDMTDIAFLEQIFPSTLAAVFNHFNHCGYYMNMGIVCAMGLYLYEERKALRWWYGFSMAFQTYGILVNSTLGSFIGTCCALVMVLAFCKRKNSNFSLRMLTPVIVVIALIAASYFGYVPTSSGQDMRVNFETLFKDGKAILTNSEDIDDAGHGRMTLWKQGLKMIAKKPIFGYGPEHLDPELSEPMWIVRPDNEIIQHGVYMGVPAMVFYLTSLTWLFIHQWKNMKNLDRSILTAAGCLIAYLVSAMFGVSVFYTTPYLYMFWGMAAGRADKSGEE